MKKKTGEIKKCGEATQLKNVPKSERKNGRKNHKKQNQKTLQKPNAKTSKTLVG